MNAKRVSRSSTELSQHMEPSEIRRTFARNLRQAREAAEVTQHGLAKAAGCSHRLLANIENKAANVKLDTISRLVKPLGLMEIDLLRPALKTVPGIFFSPTRTEAHSITEPTEFRRQFARNLRAIRRAAGLPQETVAKAAAMNLSVISEIEVNARNVTLDTVTRLAKHLGCSEIDLLAPKDR